MSTLVWVLIAIVALPILWWLLKLATSFVVPQRVAGVLLFKQELTKLGVPHAHLPPAFYEECIAWCERVSSFPPGRSPIERKAELVRSIESLAQMARLWCFDPGNSMFAQHGHQPNAYRTLFEKYSLRGDA